MFSSRVPGDLKPNRLARAVARARDAGRPIVDLTVTNPTRACFDYPPTLLAALAAPPALVYEPHPRGSSEARTAVSADYARQGTTIAPDRILLTEIQLDVSGDTVFPEVDPEAWTVVSSEPLPDPVLDARFSVLERRRG